AKLLRPYFEFRKVRDGLFSITSRMFGVRYRRVSGTPVWHPSVEVYDLYRGRRRLGRFYLDLHPRKDKYTHAAAAVLVIVTARHHETGELVPADLIAQMRRAEAFGRAYEVQRQLLYATLSLLYYTRDAGGIDTTAVLREAHSRFPLIPHFEGTHFQCNFGHLN